MFVDSETLFCSEQFITHNTASENVYRQLSDLNYRGSQNITTGKPIRIFIRVVEAFNNFNRMRVILQKSNQADFRDTDNLTYEVMDISDLGLGAHINLSFLPKTPNVNDGYFRLMFRVVGAPNTTGKITAGFIIDEQD